MFHDRYDMEAEDDGMSAKLLELTRRLCHMRAFDPIERAIFSELAWKDAIEPAYTGRGLAREFGWDYRPINRKIKKFQKVGLIIREANHGMRLNGDVLEYMVNGDGQDS